MEKEDEKLLAFEYIVFKLVLWFKNVNNISTNQNFNSDNDLSKLKVLKLHFFIVAVNSKNNNLLNIFDNFYAMPFGHVESDIYNKLDSLERFKIDTNCTIIRPNYLEILENSFNELEQSIIDEIDNAVIELKKINSEIILTKAMDLVDLSHMWYSWKVIYNDARTQNLYSKKIPSDLIKSEFKYLQYS